MRATQRATGEPAATARSAPAPVDPWPPVDDGRQGADEARIQDGVERVPLAAGPFGVAAHALWGEGRQVAHGTIQHPQVVLIKDPLVSTIDGPVSSAVCRARPLTSASR